MTGDISLFRDRDPEMDEEDSEDEDEKTLPIINIYYVTQPSEAYGLIATSEGYKKVVLKYDVVHMLTRGTRPDYDNHHRAATLDP